MSGFPSATWQCFNLEYVCAGITLRVAEEYGMALAMATMPLPSRQLTGHRRVQSRFGALRPTTTGLARWWVPTGILSHQHEPGSPLRAQASSSELAGASDWGEPISLGTVKLPANVDLQRLEVLVYQWGNSLTQNANLPLPVPIKVDKIEGGVRLGYIRLVNGVVEDLAHIDCVVCPGTKESNAMFRAMRCGRMKDQVPPGEPIIMQSLLQSLKKSIELSRV